MESVISNRLLLQAVGTDNVAQPDSVVSYVEPQERQTERLPLRIQASSLCNSIGKALRASEMSVVTRRSV